MRCRLARHCVIQHYFVVYVMQHYGQTICGLTSFTFPPHDGVSAQQVHSEHNPANPLNEIRIKVLCGWQMTFNRLVDMS